MEENKKIRYLNLVLFFAMCFVSFFAYCYIVDSGDALMYCTPHKAKNPFQFIYYSCTSWMKHNLSQGVIWSVPFSLSKLFSSGRLFDMPWWLCIGMLQFCMLGTALNVSFFFKKIFKLDVLGFILTLCFFVGGYSLNADYMHYSFNVGNGMYPFAVYIFSIYMLLSINKKDFYITRLILFVFLINLNDIVKLPALFFFVWADYYADRIDAKSIKSFSISNVKRFLAPAVFLAVNIFASFRAVNSSIIKNFAQVVEFSWRSVLERVFLYFSRLENICYDSFFDAFSLSFVSEYSHLLQLGSILIFCASLCSVIFLWKGRHYGVLKRYKLLIGLFLVTFLALYCSNARAFISLKHGHYADDNFMFLFMLFVYVSLVSVFFLLKINEARLRYYKTGLILFCLLFSVLPNIVSVYDVAIFQNNQGLRDRNYEKDFMSSIDNQKPETIPTLCYKLNEFPDKVLLRPNTFFWAPRWQHKKANSYVPGNPKDNNFRSLSSYAPAILPFDFLFLKRKTPVLLREHFFWGEAVRDYYVPEELIGKELDLTVQYNSNFAGSVAHLTLYNYKLLFSKSVGIYQVRSNLISKAQAHTFDKDAEITFVRYRGLGYNKLLFTLLDKYLIPYNRKKFTNDYISAQDYLDIVWSVINEDYLNDSYRKLENIIGNENGDKLKESLKNDPVFSKTFYLLATETKRAQTKFILRVSVKGGAPSYSTYSSKLKWKENI